MNHTHTSHDDGTGTGADGEETHPVDGFAGLDPADAPAAAEQYAADLAAELEQLGESATQPVQLQADLDDQAPGPAQSET